MSALSIPLFVRAIGEDGWAVTPPVLSDAAVGQLRAIVAPLATNGRGGARNLLDLPAIRSLACSEAVHRLVASVLGEGCFAVRALLFDKTPAANWKVVWHQDLTISTRACSDVAGYGSWTDKAGVPHVQPPISVLENMLAVRLHLDDCGTENGPVRVLGGSHRLGRLSAEEIVALRRDQLETACVVRQGGILAFRPRIVHASAPATVPHHRRVIHIEFAVGELASPLDWHRRVA